MHTATLDCITNKCSEIDTDGEETQKQIKFHRLAHSIVALICNAIKGESKSHAFGWLGLTSGSKIYKQIVLSRRLFLHI